MVDGAYGALSAGVARRRAERREAGQEWPVARGPLP